MGYASQSDFPTANKMHCIAFSPWSVTKFLGIVAAFLIGANVFFNSVKFATGDKHFYGLTDLFQLNKEFNIPSFYSGCLFLICGLLLLTVWWLKKSTGQRCLIWLFLAGTFVFLAYDEMFKVHEHLIVAMRAATGATGIFYFAWILIYGAGVLIIAFAFFPTWWALANKFKILFAASSIIYLGGAVGFEMIGGLVYEKTNGAGNFLYGVLYTIEESLEMIGLIVFSHSLMSFILAEFGAIAVSPGDQSEHELARTRAD